MGDNGKVLAVEWGKGEDAAHGGQLFAAEAAHDARLAEQGLDGRVARCDGSGVARCGTASALARTCLDGGNAASLANEVAGVEEQLVGVGDVLDIEQFYARVAFGVEVFVHILQHVLDAYLLAVSYRPHAVEGQALDDGTLEDEHRRGTRAAHEVGSLRRELRDGLGEDGVVVTVEQTDAVGAYECCPVAFAGVQDALFELGTGLGLLAESGTDDDEGAYLLLGCQIVDIVGAEPRCHHQDGQLGGGQFLHVVKSLDSLHFVFLGVDDAQGAIVTATDQVAHDGAARFVNIVRAADHDDALGL